ncbi:MAG TPA: hypothetical protein VEZ70_09135 [Allosphingosinicella sp.]|nr:hypothetical protein [Allosphingosinicella sp.]
MPVAAAVRSYRDATGAPDLMGESHGEFVFAARMAPHHLNGIGIAHGGFLASSCLQVGRLVAEMALTGPEGDHSAVRSQSCQIAYVRPAPAGSTLLFHAAVSLCRTSAVGVRVTVAAEDAPDQIIVAGWGTWTRAR